jgi:hypothetical protein
MTTKSQSLAPLESLKPEPKKRRTAQEQALAPLLKRHQLLVKRRDDAIEKVHARFSYEIRTLADAIHALGCDLAATDDDEQAPESE